MSFGKYKRTKQNFFVFLMAVVFLFVPQLTSAVDPGLPIRDSAYSALYVGQSIPDPVVLEAGETKWVIFYFKNVGTATWDSKSTRFISAYTVEPRLRQSVFYGTGWTNANQIGRMAGVVKPGETASFGVPLHAPTTPGQYKEEFLLAAENYTWIKGGYFYVDIKVVPKSEPVVSAPNVVDEVVVGEAPTAGTVDPALSYPSDVSYKADKFIQNIRSASVVGGARVDLKIAYQNRSLVDWKQNQVVTGVLKNALGTVVSGNDLGWTPAEVLFSYGQVRPKDDVFWLEFGFNAPLKRGEYLAEFIFSADGKLIEKISLPVTVTSDYQSGAVVDISQPPRLSAEPRIKVGLWKPESEVQFASSVDDYKVFAGSELKGILPKDNIAFLRYVNGEYVFGGGDINFKTTSYIRLEPANNPRAVFDLLNYSRVISWKNNVNFNRYRGALEYRHGEINPDLWVVNDLLFEDYVSGVGENSNNSPIEYLKSQSVAQRSYAYFIQQSDKYGIFDVVATTGDQLYLGFLSEGQLPNFVAAVQATRGYMATYNGAVALTPYFAHAACRTLSWQEKWGGTNRPWLISVPTNYDCKYYTSILGHGIGMSQLDASRRAEAEGLSWQDLVKYYYTGVALDKFYQ